MLSFFSQSHRTPLFDMTPREIQNEIKSSINKPPFTDLVSLSAGRKDTRVPRALNQSSLLLKLQPLPTTPTPSTRYS